MSGLADVMQQRGPHERRREGGASGSPPSMRKRESSPATVRTRAVWSYTSKAWYGVRWSKPRQTGELGNRRAHELGVAVSIASPPWRVARIPLEFDAHALAGHLRRASGAHDGEGARRSAASISKSSRQAKRTARSMRRASSSKRRRGTPTARIRPDSRSSRPSEKVEHATNGMPCHGVHGEVPRARSSSTDPPRRTLLGMTAIRIEPI